MLIDGGYKEVKDNGRKRKEVMDGKENRGIYSK